MAVVLSTTAHASGSGENVERYGRCPLYRKHWSRPHLHVLLDELL